MTFAPFDVVLVPFPFVERTQLKMRPAVVVSRDVLESNAGVIWAAMITSSEHAVAGDVEISDLGTTGLRAPSRVRSAKIACLFPANVVSRLGRLTPHDATRVAAAVRGWLADA